MMAKVRRLLASIRISCLSWSVVIQPFEGERWIRYNFSN